MPNKRQCKRWLPRINLQKSVTQRLKRTVIKKPKLVCEICKIRFSTWWDIREHWQSTGHKIPQQCRWCRIKTFTLHSHLCKQHWDLAIACKYCGEMFMYKEDYVRHVRHHDRKEYRCFLCGKRRQNEALLRQHVHNHYLHEKFGCNICEKRFKEKKNMEEHLRTIHCICQYCGEKFNNRVILKDHLLIHNDLKCVLCQKVFSQKSRLKYHYQLQHSHQEFYKCTLCFQRFVIRFRLIDHMKLKHNGISNYSCQICSMPFLYWKSYVNHFERLHANQNCEKNKFKCSYCDFTTELKIKLEWHVEKSSGIGFFCKKCQLRLKCKTMFENHMQTHAGECIWTCDYCSKVYKSADVLRNHMSRAHQEIMMTLYPQGYPCLEQACDRYYTTKSSLARHIRRVHASHASQRSERHEQCNDKIDEIYVQDRFSQRESVPLKNVVSNTSHLSTDLQMNKTDKLNNKEGDLYLKNKLEQKVDDDIESVTCVKNKLKQKKDDHIENVTSSVSHLCQSLLIEQDEEQRTKSNEEGLKNKTELNGLEPQSVCSTDSGNDIAKLSDITEVNVYYCDICDKFWFTRESHFKIHMDSHSNVVWHEKCTDCNIILGSAEGAVRHNVEHHLKVKFISQF